MEEENILQPTNEVHLEALHYVFIPRIQNHLDEFREAFIRRPLRTANQKTPLQMWIEGQIIDPFESLTESDVLLYGISQEGLMTSSDELHGVCVTEASLSEENRQELSRQIDPLSYSHNHGIELFLSTVNFILEKLVF
ncbi:hypothetical protein LOTGIDRAFT_174258 [Lottia gigantea]|uniref:Integrase core domain-containing protein n=1 Tax=Lottia gigantea TaxID=225164 RepID=V4C9Q5_LOTGI|nr:hypothetical protein LOTGIDRAFT_174258 [Lottia gigantea]ESO98489.1 hypothetical protein LOTGIDRAFT_174258 [Lottia gigantea]